MPLMDILICLLMAALGACLMAWAYEAREKAAKAERDRAEHWRRQYEALRYATRPQDAEAPAPLQLDSLGAWAMRHQGAVKRSSRA